MKQFFALFSLFLICLAACENSDDANNNSSKLPTENSESLKDSIQEKRIEHVHFSWAVGDINNDHQPDSAFIAYDVNLDSNRNELCPNKNCEITVQFNHHIPDLIIQQSLGIQLEQAKDLNNDGANDLVIFSQWVHAYWRDVSVWSLKNETWSNLADTKVSLSDDKNYKNRIIQKKGCSYLLGDTWNDSIGVIERSIAVKIGK